MLDQYGNYVLQFVVSLGNNEFNFQIMNFLIADLYNFSKQKFSSNVIEKILENSNHIIQEGILKVIVEDNNMITNLLFDQFGNYVIQKALLIAKEPYYSHIISEIQPQMDKLKKMPYGIKLYNKLCSTYKELNDKIFNSIRSTNNINMNNNINISEKTKKGKGANINARVSENKNKK